MTGMEGGADRQEVLIENVDDLRQVIANHLETLVPGTDPELQLYGDLEGHSIEALLSEPMTRIVELSDTNPRLALLKPKDANPLMLQHYKSVLKPNGQYRHALEKYEELWRSKEIHSLALAPKGVLLFFSKPKEIKGELNHEPVFATEREKLDSFWRYSWAPRVLPITRLEQLDDLDFRTGDPDVLNGTKQRVGQEAARSVVILNK